MHGRDLYTKSLPSVPQYVLFMCLLILGFVGWAGGLFGILLHNSYWIYRFKVFLGPLMPVLKTDIALATCYIEVFSKRL